MSSGRRAHRRRVDVHNPIVGAEREGGKRIARVRFALVRDAYIEPISRRHVTMR